MIYAKRSQLSRYLGICPALDTAIRYLKTADLSTLLRGRNEVDGDEVFINLLEYTTVPVEEAQWEGHARYGDIHIMVRGREQIGVTDVQSLKQTVYQPEHDFLGFEGPVQNWYPMEEEDVLIVFPEDVHMVKVQLDAPMDVSRAVVKFRV